MRPFRLVGFLLGLSLLAAGCASTGNTLAQDLAWERWQKCTQEVPGPWISEIRADGQIWYYYRGPAQVQAMNECLQKAAAEQAQGRPVVKAPEPVGSPAASGPPIAPAWKPGDEWAFRWESPRGKGTFVRSVDREETLEGVECYVLKFGRDREIYFRKADLAYYIVKVEGAVETRHSPPSTWFTWPLTTGKTWEMRFTEEKPLDRKTTERVRACRVEAEESVIVPAGTFRAFKVVCRNARTGSITSERWYSPEIKNEIRVRTHFSYGVEEWELLAFKLK